MRSKLIQRKANFVLCSYIGNRSGVIGWLKEKFWTWRIKHMSDGEILNRYYLLADREV